MQTSTSLKEAGTASWLFSHIERDLISFDRKFNFVIRIVLNTVAFVDEYIQKDLNNSLDRGRVSVVLNTVPFVDEYRRI